MRCVRSTTYLLTYSGDTAIQRPSKSVDDDGPMDVEAPASPRREQQRTLMEASEALASKAQLAHHRPPESETRPIRRFRRPRM